MGGAKFGVRVCVDYAESVVSLDKRAGLIYHALYDPSLDGTIPATVPVGFPQWDPTDSKTRYAMTR